MAFRERAAVGTRGQGIAGEVLAALARPEGRANPYPLYRALRTYEPVKRMPDGSLFLTRYKDVQAVYRDPKVFSSDKTVEFKPKYGASPL